MNRFWPWLAILVFLLAIGGVYLIQMTPFQVDQESAVRSVVEDFGQELKNVSLLASREQVASSMQASYGPYVENTLLGQWINDPLSAPGRLTSSPWPEKIEISSIQKEDNTRYTVEGDVIEVTNEGGGIGETPTEALRRPITLVVEKKGSGWRITSVQLGAYPGDGDWTLSQPDSQGIQFMYPQKLPTSYITAQEWPPQVTLTAGEQYSCAEQDERMVGDRAFCVVKTNEGAAGTTYSTYEYITAQGDFLARVKFTLKFPQCMNYDEPNQSACKNEQASFDIDGLVDRLASSIRML
jgi:hypothetical protein